jgi:hypothetical protein
MRGTLHTGTLFTWRFGVLIVDDNWLFLRREERWKIISNGPQREPGVWRYPRGRSA